METQYNEVSKIIYQGRNQVELQSAKEKNGYKSNGWCTFLQAKELKMKVKKGSKGVSIFKGFGKIDEKDKDGKVKTKSIINGYSNVFNFDCLEPYEKS